MTICESDDWWRYVNRMIDDDLWIGWLMTICESDDWWRSVNRKMICETDKFISKFKIENELQKITLEQKSEKTDVKK